jgi:hypothetical protein
VFAPPTRHDHDVGGHWPLAMVGRGETKERVRIDSHRHMLKYHQQTDRRDKLTSGGPQLWSSPPEGINGKIHDGGD